MPIVQAGKYFNVKLDPGEQIVLTKQYEGAGKTSVNGSVRYSFIDAQGNSVSVFVTPELSMQLATITVGTAIILKKDRGEFGKISATMTDGSPLSSATPQKTPAPLPRASTFDPANPAGTPVQPVAIGAPVGRQRLSQKDITIAWQNANNAAALLMSQTQGDTNAKIVAFAEAQQHIFESFLEEFDEEALRQRKLLKEANKLFDGTGI